MLYPATSSASDSTKSNGTLFVSASVAIKKMKAKGKNKNIFQELLICKYAISLIFKLPEIAKIGSKEKLKKTSYEII